MRIALNEWFSLPRLGRDVFADLMKARVKYDSKFGFKFTSGTDVPRALGVLSRALEQPVELETVCFICDIAIGEDEEAGSVICSKCTERDDAYTLYCMKFATMIENI